MRFFTRVLLLLLFTLMLLIPNFLIQKIWAAPIGSTLFLNPPDSTTTDTTDKVDLKFPFQGDDNLFYTGGSNHSNLFLQDPKNLQQNVVFDPKTNQYVVTNKMGDLNYRPAQRMDMDEYRQFEEEQSLENYWTERSNANNAGANGGIIPSIHIGGKVFDRIFGGNTIDIRPQGSAELMFGVVNNKREDPALNVRQQSVTNFDFQQKIQLNVLAKIGDKIEFKVNYNTEATFDFENKLKLKYEGDEDEIIKLIEAGDVTLPLTSTLIQGSQSLFGIKTKLQFGKLTVTSVFSQQKSESSSLTVQGGAQTNEFELRVDQYEENKHFLLAEYFKNNYEVALEELPIVNSNINITKTEVWVTNIGSPTTDNRNIVAFQDLGEYNPYFQDIYPVPGNSNPDDNSNDLRTNVIDTNVVRDISSVTNHLQSKGMTSGIDYEKVELARKLKPTEYSVNTKLGFISLNTRLNPDQVLAISYQYTIIGDPEQKVYQVGEFSDEGIIAPNTLIVKLLKSTSVNTSIPLWDLMMKNIYNIGAYQVNSEDFIMNILYTGGEDGVPKGYLPQGDENIKGVPLIEVMNFDNLDQQSNPYPDGVFDFINNAATLGGTIQASNGRVFFTMLEPFGKYLRDKLGEGNEALADLYCYDSLYSLTKSEAQQYPAKNKYLLEGYYKSSSGSEISLNALNVPAGSVRVTAGGIPLTENVDYTVDYTLGRVRIINEGILNSGTPINISMESNSAFALQQKRMMGAHFDYEVNQNLHLGGTILNLSEKPITQKTNIGDDPINNTIWGLDMSYQKESRWITKMVDKLPLIETDARSLVTLNGEFAHFLPGHSKAIGNSGTSYIDDFEGTKSTIDLKMVSRWVLASTPQGQTEAGMFPEGKLNTGLNYGKNRAKLAWYIIDPLFYDQGNLRPPNITAAELSKDEVRQVLEKEVFPNKETPNGYPTNIPVFNLAYYPTLKGPYNYDVEPEAGGTAGIDEFGNLLDPESRWGGIMREIETSDFESTNVEYLEFWIMDPFINNTESDGGELYINLGDVSEDVLRDSRKGFENGLPVDENKINVDSTIWGLVPSLQSLVDAFDNRPEARPFQDVGFDGLRDVDERGFFEQQYLDIIANKYGAASAAYANANVDPSGDNFHYFRGSDYDNDATYESILERYKMYNGPEGNSPASEFSNETYTTTGTTRPDVEDINRDNTLSESERYFQYQISLHPDDMEVGRGYITDMRQADNVKYENGDDITTKWYQFKIPIKRPNKVVGQISDFNSIRFMRMFMKGFKEQTVLRFATLELVRSDWRKYEYSLLSPGEYVPNDQQSGTIFETAAINIEENGQRTPIPYVLPPGIDREVNIGTTNLQRQNEQSMQIITCGLVDGDARAVFKTTDFDFRRYKRLKMFVHAERSSIDDNLEDGELTLFLRMGSDFTDNYYEYEVPLNLTEWGTSDPYAIWPDANSLDIELEKLVDTKLNRNIAERADAENISLILPYSEMDGENIITVLGAPSLSDVRAIMIGIRNPKKQGVNDTEDDGLPKCAEVWVNELRVTDFDNKSAWAATARAKVDLADFGNVIISGTHSTAGFGGLESKINDRQQEDITNFDIATNLSLGKLFPEEWGVKVPMHFDYSESRLTPEYNPLDPDINFDKDLDSYATTTQKDSVKALSQDVTIRKNINFINVRKDRTGQRMTKQKPWDIENFDVSYSYSEIFHRSIDVEYHLQKTYRGGLGYNLALSPKPVEPFKKMKMFRGKSLRIIRDFNFYYMPKLFSFRMDVNREYADKRMRNKSRGDVPMRWTWTKRFDWNRNYNLKFDLTKGLKFEYAAQASASIDEPAGRIDRGDANYMDFYRDSVWSSIISGGRMNQFDQSISLNYSIPINKIPLFDWVTANARYQGDYHWTASPQSLQSRLGNTIENSNTLSLNTNVRMEKLYNKIPYLKKLNQKSRGRNRKQSSARRGATGKESNEQAQDTTKKKTEVFKIIADNTLKLLMMWKDGSVTWSQSKGNLMPGFYPEPGALGNNWSQMAPGIGYVFGWENDITKYSDHIYWLSQDSSLNTLNFDKFSTNLNARATFEPIRDLRIELTATRTYSYTRQSYYKYDSDFEIFQEYTPTERGSFSMSFLTIGTSFDKIADDNSTKTYTKMKEYRLQMANRLAGENPNYNGEVIDSTGYPSGYSASSQDVLHGAFVAAYTNRSPDAIPLNYFPKIPFPNWRVTYKGLSKIPALRKLFKNVTVTHSYRSAYSIGSYVSNVNYDDAGDIGHPSAVNVNGDFINKYDMTLLSISEQFSPLLKLDMTWNNSLLTNFEYKKSRNLSLSFVGNQLTEVSSNEYIIGVGYRIKNVKFAIKTLGSKGKKKQLNSDLNLKIDFSVRDNKTVLRRLDQEIDQISSGQRITSLNFSADYMVSQKFTVRLYFDKIMNKPHVANQYPNSTTSGGLSLRFTLTQ